MGVWLHSFLGLWQGRNTVAERHGWDRAAYLMVARKQRDRIRQERARKKMYPSRAHTQ
jgi:hypothetical protein